MERNVVGPRVQEARRHWQPPLTQRDLVARLQVMGLRMEQSTISKIEHGRRPVLDLEVLALAKALQVSAGWLLSEEVG